MYIDRILQQGDDDLSGEGIDANAAQKNLPL
jgi:hypothetical protein